MQYRYRVIEVDAKDIENHPTSFTLTGTTLNLKELTPRNPTTAEGLLKLQIKDFITGECDRHPENYFIDDLGKVKGIDEDCCFGVNAAPEGVDVRQ